MAETTPACSTGGFRPLLDEYATLLCRFVTHPNESDRRRARAIGELLIAEGCGPEQLLDLHAQALRKCESLRPQEGLKYASDLLNEATAPFIACYRKQAEVHRAEAECYRQYAHLLERLNQELNEKHQALQAAHEEQTRLNQQKTDLLNLVGHEIRTPLTALLGYGEFLEEGTYGALSEQQLEVLHRMIQSGKDLLLLINNLLDLSRLEGGRLSLDRQATSLSELLGHAVEQVDPLAHKGGLSLTIASLPADLPLVWVDPMRIIQVLVNLLGNAIKFTKPGGSITISARPLGNDVAVEVKDTGIGISPEAQKSLFQRFTQVENVKQYGGTGLGLSISKELLALHGGHIEVDSELGRGATFKFTLPVWNEADHPNELPPLKLASPEAGS
ncbi:HAMP domain-containing histidine kinase [bacterium]|nr:HAMP domain-containing histidine kinase [bacterium]